MIDENEKVKSRLMCKENAVIKDRKIIEDFVGL